MINLVERTRVPNIFHTVGVGEGQANAILITLSQPSAMPNLLGSIIICGKKSWTDYF